MASGIAGAVHTATAPGASQIVDPRAPGESYCERGQRQSRNEAVGSTAKLLVAVRPSGCRDDEGDLGVQSLGGGKRPIVLKFTGAAVDLDRIESHPCCRLLLTKSVEQCLISWSDRSNKSCCPSAHNRSSTVAHCG